MSMILNKLISKKTWTINIVLILTGLLWFVYTEHPYDLFLKDYRLSKVDTLVDPVFLGAQTYVKSFSPDEKYFAAIKSDHYPSIDQINSKDLPTTTIFKSKYKFPDNVAAYATESLWSKDGDYVVFPYFDELKNDGNILVWSRKKGKEWIIPDIAECIWVSDSSRLIAVDNQKKHLFLISFDPFKITKLSDASLLLPPVQSTYYQIHNLRWLSDNSVIYLVDIYNDDWHIHFEHPRENKTYDHTEIRIIDLRNQSTKIIGTSPYYITLLKLFPDLQKSIISQCEYFFSVLEKTKIPGKSGIYDLSSEKCNFSIKNILFQDVSPDGNKILCTIYVPSKKGYYYGIYSEKTNEVSLLKTRGKKNYYIPSFYSGSKYYNHHLILQLDLNNFMVIKTG